MGIVNYSTTTVNQQGILVKGNVTYNVNVTIVNNELQRLACSITKQETEDESPLFVGNINLEYGRQIIEVTQGEDLIPHLTIFNEIMNEVLDNTKID